MWGYRVCLLLGFPRAVQDDVKLTLLQRWKVQGKNRNSLEVCSTVTRTERIQGRFDRGWKAGEAEFGFCLQRDPLEKHRQGLGDGVRVEFSLVQEFC